MITAAVTERVFARGTCVDACVGTLLARAGVDDPAEELFARIDFNWNGGHARDSVRFYPPGRHHAVAASYGCELLVERSRDLDELIAGRVRPALAGSQAVAVAVDHFHYPPSAWFGKLHQSHFVLLTELRPAGYQFVDPFPRFSTSGVASEAELREWCTPDNLGPDALTSLRLEGDPIDHAPDWRSALEQNLTRMTVGGAEQAGATQARALAAAMRERPDYASESPLDGLVNIGASRSGHAAWLRKLGALLERQVLLEAGGQLERAGAQWDITMALVQRLRLAHDSPAGRFSQRKSAGIPDAMTALADLEARALGQAALAL